MTIYEGFFNRPSGGVLFLCELSKKLKIPDLVLPQSDSPTQFFANGLVFQLGLILPAVSEN